MWFSAILADEYILIYVLPSTSRQRKSQQKTVASASVILLGFYWLTERNISAAESRTLPPMLDDGTITTVLSHRTD